MSAPPEIKPSPLNFGITNISAGVFSDYPPTPELEPKPFRWLSHREANRSISKVYLLYKVLANLPDATLDMGRIVTPSAPP